MAKRVADVTLMLKKGKKKGAEPPDDKFEWTRGKEQNSSTKRWTEASEFWYYFKGGNYSNKKECGDVELNIEDVDNEFKIEEKGNSLAIERISLVNAPSGVYSIRKPIGGVKYWRIVDRYENNPMGSKTEYRVYARSTRSSGPRPLVMCHPMIYNRRGGGN